MAGKQERQRRLARERHERRMAREAARQQRTRQMTKYVSGGAVLLVLIGIVTFTSMNLAKGNTASPGASPSATVTPAASTTPTPTPTPTPTESVAANGTVQCSYVAKPPAARNVGLPPQTADTKLSYQATIKTNRGDIVINLANSKAPCTVNSFVFLASKGYFNSSPCHRLTTSGIYVLQCGDPTGTGGGGPGYQFADENLTGATYPAATVAMANAGPGTNGSQFFLVYKDTTLQPNYTPFGTIVSGLNILQQVASAGSDNANGAGDGHPKEKVTIESVTIKKT